MFWNTLYAPSTRLIFPSISRHWAQQWGGWVVGEWDCFFGSLLTSLEDKAQTVAAMRDSFGANRHGGCSQYCRRLRDYAGSLPASGGLLRNVEGLPAIQDRALLEWAYPRLKKWHEWWFHDEGMVSRGGTEIATAFWSGAATEGSTPRPGGADFFRPPSGKPAWTIVLCTTRCTYNPRPTR